MWILCSDSFIIFFRDSTFAELDPCDKASIFMGLSDLSDVYMYYKIVGHGMVELWFAAAGPLFFCYLWRSPSD